MYVYEEMVDGKKLTEIINTQHENIKYLPGTRLPENIVSVAMSFPRDVLVRCYTWLPLVREKSGNFVLGQGNLRF